MDSHSSVGIGLIVVVIGIIAGLVFSWFIMPVEFIYLTPAELEPQYRPTWIKLVAASYTVEDDWGRAEFRLNSLGEPDIKESVGAVFRQAVAEFQPPPILRALARLADRLGARTPEMIIYLATPVPTSTPNPEPSPTLTPPSSATPSPTFVLPPTPTPLPTLTPTPTPLPNYLIISQDRVCKTGIGNSQIHVNVEGADGQGIPGVEVWVNWDGGADRLLTGLKPELGSGYGDFDMKPGIAYNVSVGTSASPLVSNLKAEVCPSNVPTQTAYAVWVLMFRTVPPTPTPTPTVTLTPTLEITATITP